MENMVGFFWLNMNRQRFTLIVYSYIHTVTIKPVFLKKIHKYL